MQAANGPQDELAGFPDELAELRSDPRFAEVVCFLRTFSRVLRYDPVSCDVLEAALLAPAQWTALLAELHGRLTRRSHELSVPWQPSLEERWAVRLARYVGERRALWAGARESPLKGRAPPAAYAALSAVKRLDLLHSLCVARLDSCTAVAEGIRLTVENGAAHALRELPIGTDALGRRYFHIAAAGEDCRVFRETPEVTTGGKYPTLVAPAAWETRCVTLEDVRDWVAELGASAEASACWAEAQLHSVAASELLPVLEASHEERAAGFASAEARERERDKARQAARQRALQPQVAEPVADGPVGAAPSPPFADLLFAGFPPLPSQALSPVPPFGGQFYRM